MCHIHWYFMPNALEYTTGPSGMVADDAIAPAFIVRTRDARGSYAGGATLSGTTADVTVIRVATTESCH